MVKYIFEKDIKEKNSLLFYMNLMILKALFYSVYYQPPIAFKKAAFGRFFLLDRVTGSANGWNELVRLRSDSEVDGEE